MPRSLPRSHTYLIACSLLLIFAVEGSARPNSEEINQALETCPVVQQLNKQKLLGAPETSGIAARIFAILFPGTPAVNALLGTLYISGPPNFLLALCPPNIDPGSLTVMVAFAVGGLLGDTLFHLLPEIFLGEDSPEHVRFVLVENNKNLLLGVAIIVGFVTFVAMDKALRIATGGAGHEHDHGQSSAEKEKKEQAAVSTSVDNSNELRLRKAGANSKDSEPNQAVGPDASTSIKLSAYLNLIADFTHNITDGLAMSSSFYASPTLGATTTAAVFFHEIPHEVGDFALLIQGGFTKGQAMGAQFITAAGAFLGTCIGIAVQELGKSSQADVAGQQNDAGLFGTGLGWGDMLLPFTAGTFLYVGTVAVIPELLETGENKRDELWKTAKQFAAMAAGASIMIAISWS